MSEAHIYWTDVPRGSPSDCLAWVYMGTQFVGILSMDEEAAVEFHNALGDGRVTEHGWVEAGWNDVRV